MTALTLCGGSPGSCQSLKQAEQLIRDSEAAVSKGDAERAKRLAVMSLGLLQKYDKSNARAIKALTVLGCVCRKLKQYGQAEKALTTALSIEQKLPAELQLTSNEILIRWELATTYDQEGNLEKAAREYSVAYQYWEKYPVTTDHLLWVTVALANVLNHQGKYSEALSYLSRADEIVKDQKRVSKDMAESIQFWRAGCLMRLKRWRDAELCARALPADNPGRTAVLSLVLAQQGRIEEAQSVLKQNTISQDVLCGESLAVIDQYLIRHGEFQKGMQYFERAERACVSAAHGAECNDLGVFAGTIDALGDAGRLPEAAQIAERYLKQAHHSKKQLACISQKLDWLGLSGGREGRVSENETLTVPQCDSQRYTIQ